ncbi:MAG: arginine--tRNA ligase [Polyangiaceae bacterium]
MLSLLDELGRSAAAALRASLGDAAAVPDVLPIVRSQKDDLQTAAALQFAKAAKKPPRELADVIAKALASHPAVAGTEIAGPGFVNVRLSDTWLVAHAGDGLVMSDVGKGQRVVLDYSSPNVAKPMHIAHIRSTIIGDAIKRSMRAVGYEVVADNHLGDWGTQFGKLIVAYRKWLDADAFAKNPVDELLRIYIRFTEEEKAQRGANAKAPTVDDADDDVPDAAAPPILQEARAELVKLQKGDPENVALWKSFVDVSMKEFDRIYARLGVSFDVVLGESAYNDALAKTVETLLAKGIAEESEGAIVVTFDKARDGEALPPLLVRKADGGFLYGTTDIAGVLYRVERWNPSRIVIVTDERQQLHFRQFFAAARRLGITTSLEHVWFGLMRLPEGTISTREGKIISLESLLDEAERRALVVAREANAELDEKEAREIARVVGLGAVKYNDLSKDRQTLVTFTWDKALALTGNTAPYLQYAYARIRSMGRKATEQGFTAGPIVSMTPVERELVLRLLGFAGAVHDVAKTTRPHLLCDYLFDLAMAFSTFYNEAPVLKAEPDVRAGRLTLAALVADTLQKGLDLLGIDVVERM